MPIREMFPARGEDPETRLPHSIDAVIFDPRNDHLFFFKDELVSLSPVASPPLPSHPHLFSLLQRACVFQVWEVDPFEAEPTCCVAIHNFTDLYPIETNDGVLRNVDAGYLRWFEKQVYFYKGDHVYRAALWTEGAGGRREWQRPIRPAPLIKIGLWNQFWNDICDVITPIFNSCFNTDA